MNKTQVTTTTASIAAFIAGILSTQFTFLDQATWLAVVTALITLGSAVIAYLTRETALTNQVGKFSGTTIVTTPEVANSLPNNMNVIGTDEAKVVLKSKV